jgi:autotransporter-associated beta strand protein
VARLETFAGSTPAWLGIALAAIAWAAAVDSARAIDITGYSSTVNDRFATGFPAGPVPNPSGSFVGVAYDWSGVGWDPGFATKGFGFITPQHYLVAAHYGGAATITVRGADGTLRSGTQAAVTNTGYGGVEGGSPPDLSLGRLTTAMPASWQVARYAVLDLNPTSVTNSPYTGQPLLVYGRGDYSPSSPRIGAATVNGTVLSGSISYVSSSRSGDPSVKLENGDSGSPIFIPWTNPAGVSQLTILGNNFSIDASNNYYNYRANSVVLDAINALTTPDGFALWVRGDVNAVWTGAANSSISAGGNWSGGARTDQYVEFRAGSVPTTVDVDAPTNLRGLFFEADAGATEGFTLTGADTLTIGRGGLTNDTSLRQTLSATVALGDDQYWDVGAGGVTAAAIDTIGTLLEIAGSGTARITGPVSGSGGLALSGHRLELTGSSGYGGDTWVHAGTLVVDGSITSRVFVGAGAVVGGTGSIVNVVTILAGGTVSPGSVDATGILTVGGLDLQPSSTALMQITGAAAGTGYDRIVATGDVEYAGGTLQVQLSGTGYAVGAMFELFDAGSVSGTLAAIGMAGSGDGWQGVSWYAPGQGSDPTLGTFAYGVGVWQSSWTTVGGESRKLIFDQASGTLIVVPEPATVVLAGAGLVAATVARWRRRRRGAGAPGRFRSTGARAS